MCYAKPGPRCDTAVLTRLIDALGLQRGRINDAHMETRVELLMTRGGLEGLTRLVEQASDATQRQTLLSVYRTARQGYQARMEQIGKSPRALNGPQGWEEAPLERSPEMLQRAAVDLYLRQGSPLYAKARSIEKKVNSVMSGYVPAPGTGQISVLATEDIAKQMNIDPNLLPVDVVAYDIETDTRNGFGLQPHRTQITEIVLTDRERTIVLSGDEKELLQGFSDYMNSLPSGTRFVGWNNQGFDNPVIYLRGQYHQQDLEGWGMSIQPSTQQGGYGPVGGYESNQSMIWTTPDGHKHFDKDVMLSLLNAPSYDGKSLRLKAQVKAWGATPIELDRSKMHEYSPQERQAYAASDGLSTLFAYQRTGA